MSSGNGNRGLTHVGPAEALAAAREDGVGSLPKGARIIVFDGKEALRAGLPQSFLSSSSSSSSLPTRSLYRESEKAAAPHPPAATPPPPPSASPQEKPHLFLCARADPIPYAHHHTGEASDSLSSSARPSANLSSYDSSATTSLSAPAVHLTKAVSTERGRPLPPPHCAEGLGTPAPSPSPRQDKSPSPPATSVTDASVIDVDISSEDGEGDRPQPSKEQSRKVNLDGEGYLLRQYRAVPWSSREAAVGVPGINKTLNVKLVTLADYEKTRAAQTYPSLLGRLAPPEDHHHHHDDDDRQRQQSDNAGGWKKAAPRSSSTASTRLSCGCVSSCTCRCRHTSCRVTDSSSGSHSSMNPSSSSSFSSSSSCSTCECSSCASGSSSDTCSHDSCEDCRRRHRLDNERRQRRRQPQPQRHGTAEDGVFQMSNLLAVPQLLCLPAVSFAKRGHEGGDDGGGATLEGGQEAAEVSRRSVPAPFVLPPPPPPLPSSSSAEERPPHPQQRAEREHQQFVEEALTVVGANVARATEQLRAVQAEFEQRERELTQRLAIAEEQRAAADRQLRDMHEDAERRVEAAKRSWEGERAGRRTERPTSPVVPFSSLAVAECERQREGRRYICSKGTMTCSPGTAASDAERREGEEAIAEQTSRLARAFLESDLRWHLAALASEEQRARGLLEAGSVSEFGLLAAACSSVSFQLSQRHAEQRRLELEAAREAQLRRREWRLQRLLCETALAEEAQRRGIEALEERTYAHDTLLPAQRERSSLVLSACTAERGEHQAALARLTAAVSALEQERQDSLERERTLRLQLLHALRMPSTTIVQRPSFFDVRTERTRAATDGDDDDATEEAEARMRQRWMDEMELPVHRRFARAHQEAVKAVRAQQRHP